MFLLSINSQLSSCAPEECDMPLPTQNEIRMPLLDVIDRLGGYATPQQIYPKVAEYFPQITPQELEETLPSSPQTNRWWNRVQWTRQALIAEGLIDGSQRGLWKITQKGLDQLKATPPSQPAPFAQTQAAILNDRSRTLFSGKSFELLASLAVEP